MKGSLAVDLEKKYGYLEQAMQKYALELYGNKNTRLHLKVSKQVKELIIKESLEMNMSSTEYIILIALALDKDELELSHKLACVLHKISKYTGIKQEKCNKSLEEQAEEGRNDYIMSRLGRPPKEEKESVHIRLTKRTNDILKMKAAEMGLSVSDYIEFAVSVFDVMSVSEEINEINRKLDKLLAAQK